VYILEQGEPPSSLYLILSGEVDVIREDEDGTTRVLDRLRTGQFFGELGIAHRAPRAAHVVSAESVTCLIFSPGDPTAFAVRGAEQAGQAVRFAQPADQGDATGATNVVDVSGYVDRKLAAIAANASQFTFRPDMFPRPLLVEMLGREHFLWIDPPVEPERSLLP
jgi:cyclic nucleotide-binding protein